MTHCFIECFTILICLIDTCHPMICVYYCETGYIFNKKRTLHVWYMIKYHRLICERKQESMQRAEKTTTAHHIPIPLRRSQRWYNFRLTPFILFKIKFIFHIKGTTFWSPAVVQSCRVRTKEKTLLSVLSFMQECTANPVTGLTLQQTSVVVYSLPAAVVI